MLMTKDAIIKEASKLSIEDQHEIIVAIDDMLAQKTGDWGVSQEQKAEILRRLDEYELDPSIALTEEQLEEQLDDELP